MILILADDLSGAAELAGIAASRGLKAEVQVTVGPGLFLKAPSSGLQTEPCSAADVIAIDTQTRSLSPEAAAAKIRSVYEQERFGLCHMHPAHPIGNDPGDTLQQISLAFLSQPGL